MMKSDSASRGIEVELADEDKLDVWTGDLAPLRTPRARFLHTRLSGPSPVLHPSRTDPRCSHPPSPSPFAVRYTSFPEGSQLAADLAVLKAGLAQSGGSSSSSGASSSAAPVACVECQMTLPPDYPFAPPSIHIVRPRFKRAVSATRVPASLRLLLSPPSPSPGLASLPSPVLHSALIAPPRPSSPLLTSSPHSLAPLSQTGYVISGALCMELLTPQGWNATFSIEALLEQVRTPHLYPQGLTSRLPSLTAHSPHL